MKNPGLEQKPDPGVKPGPDVLLKIEHTSSGKCIITVAEAAFVKAWKKVLKYIALAGSGGGGFVILRHFM